MPKPCGRPVLFLAVILLSSTACDRRSDAAAPESAPAPPGPFLEIATPAGEGSRTPRFSSADHGPILSWQERGTSSPDAHAVRYASWVDGTWTLPSTIVERPDLFVNWADYPSVVQIDSGVLAAHWLQYNGSGTYAYQVRLSLSNDDGLSWSSPVVPHETTTRTEHGFVSMAPRSEGVDVFWLDGRAFESGREEMSLRHAFVDREGRVGVETELDARTCDCCQTSVATIPGGLIAAYRDRSHGEIRDISVVRLVDGEWSSPTTVHADGWHIDACPVNGPAIVTTGGMVYVAWFTAADESAAVLVASSMDGGETFGTPVRVDRGHPLGRIGLLSTPEGGLVVAWLEAGSEDGTGASVVLRRIGAGGRPSEPIPVGETSAARASGVPALALDGSDVLVAWTDPDTERVRVVRGPLNGSQ